MQDDDVHEGCFSHFFAEIFSELTENQILGDL